MAVSRRRFIATTATVGAASALETQVKHVDAAFSETASQLFRSPPGSNSVMSTTTLPSYAVIALNRMGFGPRPGDVAAFVALGATPDARLQAYVNQQLNPDAINDSACDAKLTAARLKIKYDAKTDDPDPNKNYPARNEAAPLGTLAQQLSELWPRALGQIGANRVWSERMRPFEEVRVATWLRAVYSNRQLKEVLVDFWHNHFNVNINSDAAIAATLPLYDRLIRTHCLGNFRAFLEEVAKSIAMLYYLDNISNKAGGGEGGNENYSRELFELHTLGSDNYLKFYDDRGSVGTITYNGQSYPRGYIDRDIYETARCLSGWTLNNGHWEHPTPNDGTFLFFNDWHDNALKIVLATNFPYNQGLNDGKKVFDLLAGHPGTARFICTKLCRRLIADDPPSSVVDAAVAVWMANISAPDQLKQVVRTILLSAEFKGTWGQKMKRPFEFLVSYFRATNATLPVDEIVADPNGGNYWSSFFWNIGASGHKLFEWATPTGHPDRASYWASTNGMLRRWNLPYVLTQSWGGNVDVDLRGQTDAEIPNGSCIQIVDYWIGRLCGYTINATVRQELINFMAQKSQGGDPTQPPKPMNGEPNTAQLITDRLTAMVQLLAMSPDFQSR
jgi:uncharacterized protein (DUF1800 family)